MRILITNDVEGWAIGNLTDAIIKHNKNRFNFIKVPVHPRGVGESLIPLKDAIDVKGVDLWHGQYWNSSLKMFDYFPHLRKQTSLLTHHNHHCLNKDTWEDFNSLNEMTQWGVDKLSKIHENVFKIPHGIDLDRFAYIDELTENKNIGYIGRVVPWKCLKEICEAANKFEYNVVGSGYIDDVKYWEEIPRDRLEFNGGTCRAEMASASFKDDLYEDMMCFVMYSTGEKESGTLPLLEAMASGVPILATEQGMARDLIKDGVNGVFFNEENFEEKLQLVMEDKKLREKIRKNAWETIKNYSESKMARDYAKVYYKTVFKDNPVISVIIPTFDRAEKLYDIIESIDSQTYPAKEIIIVEDGDDGGKTKKVCEEIKKHLKTPVIYMNTGNANDYYGLAQARNMGACEALGEVLLFLDDRYALEPDALEHISKCKNNHFDFGVKVIKGKESTKKAFIENFAWIRKKDFFKAGMFNERLNMYGGLSQETRTRFNAQGFKMNQDKSVKCKEILSSRKNKNKSEIWKAKFLLSKIYE